MVRFFFFFIFLLSSRFVWSQCYEPLRAEGLRLEEEGDFEEAINRYLAALNCPDKLRNNDLATLIKRALRARVIQLETALSDLQHSNARVVRLLLKNAEQDILKLQYEAALNKIKTAGELGELKEEVVLAYLEIAFWHNEAGHVQRALGILDSAAALVKKESLIPGLEQIPTDTTAARDQLRSTLQQFDNATYRFLRERYYPVMLVVPGGTFTMGCDPAIDPNCEDGETQHPATVANFQIAILDAKWSGTS